MTSQVFDITRDMLDFECYLPQDNEDTANAEQIIQIISTSLSQLLQFDTRQFWNTVSASSSLEQCLSSYLQHARRPYTFIEDGSAPSLSRHILARNVFLTFHRLVQNEQKVHSSQQKEALLKIGLLDIPNLMDFAVLFLPSNPALVQSLFSKIREIMPSLIKDIETMSPIIVSSLRNVTSTCEEATKKLIKQGDLKLYGELADGLQYLRDCCQSIICFMKAFRPSSEIFAQPKLQLVSQFAHIHNSLLLKGTKCWNAYKSDQNFQGVSARLLQGLYWLGQDLEDFVNDLISLSCLSSPTNQSGPPGYSSPTKVSPKSMKDKGSSLLSILQASLGDKIGSDGKSLPAQANKKCSLDQQIITAITQGILILEPNQLKNISELLGSDVLTTAYREKMTNGVSSRSHEARQNLIDQVKEILPDYGDGFISACLDAFGNEPQATIQNLLEGTLPDFLKRMDPKQPLSQPESSEPRISHTNGTSSNQAGPSGLKWRELEDVERATAGIKIQEGPIVSSTKPLLTSHKGTAKALQASDQEKAIARLHAQAAQWEEYEDEYDDSYDDLGGYDADPNADPLGDETETTAGILQTKQNAHSRSNLQTLPKGGKPLWVLDGKIYNHRKEGATPVPNQEAANDFIRASKDEINGLGEGGNKALHLPREDEGSTQSGFGRGRGRGRGSGRGREGPSDLHRARVFKDMNKSAIGNHHRKDRALRKMGGPAG